MSRLLIAAVAATLTMLGLLSPAATPAQAQADQVLTWTADGGVTEYASAPAEAAAGPATIVFENSVATGNTIGMPHSLTFDTSTPGYNHDVTLNILANPNDANGGLHEAEVTLTPGTYRYFCTIPGHGQMVGELVVTDGGGGEDTTAPTVTAEVAGEQDADGNYLDSATVTVAAEDAGSGVDTIEYQLDDGDFQPYTEPVAVTGIGAHMLPYRATDVAGNVSEEGMVSFTVVEGDGGGGDDTTAPTVTAEATGEQDGDGNYLDSATVTVTAEDAGSGVDTIEYQLDDGDFQPYTEPVAVTGIGAHMLHYRATDVAGNVSEQGMLSFTVAVGPDVEGPVVTAAVSGDQNASYEYLGRATIELAATDDKSGVDVLEYALNGGAWTSYTRPVLVSTMGTHTVRYRAFDNAGNASVQSVGSFTVVPPDSTPARAGDIWAV